MSGINKVILIGHLGKDPETKTLENGSKRVSFTLATTEVYKDRDGQRKEVTEWHNIVCWRNLADIAEKYLTKGKLLYVEGRIRTRSWDENGSKRFFTEIEANNFTMLGNKSEKPTEQKIENAIPVSFVDTETPPSDDGLPF
ncbi:MAG: single-stranded DNA-binding protein [Bacteroidales bacterium]|jgi:single-strand DNA-binding protein|nr:single-stranded DNA-binding protein [Bacteroidales bacterium]